MPTHAGDRIRLIEMPEDPLPIPPGSTGTVERIEPLWDKMVQIHVRWDSGRTLSLITPKDKFEVIS